jgi:hypothetical protein
VTDDELTDMVITAATCRYRYGEEELGYVVAGIITEQLGIDDEGIDCDLVEEWLRQFRLAVSKTTGFARAMADRKASSAAKR